MFNCHVIDEPCVAPEYKAIVYTFNSTTTFLSDFKMAYLLKVLCPLKVFGYFVRGEKASKIGLSSGTFIAVGCGGLLLYSNTRGWNEWMIPGLACLASTGVVISILSLANWRACFDERIQSEEKNPISESEHTHSMSESDIALTLKVLSDNLRNCGQEQCNSGKSLLGSAPSLDIPFEFACAFGYALTTLLQYRMNAKLKKVLNVEDKSSSSEFLELPSPEIDILDWDLHHKLIKVLTEFEHEVVHMQTDGDAAIKSSLHARVSDLLNSMKPDFKLANNSSMEADLKLEMNDDNMTPDLKLEMNDNTMKPEFKLEINDNSIKPVIKTGTPNFDYLFDGADNNAVKQLKSVLTDWSKEKRSNIILTREERLIEVERFKEFAKKFQAWYEIQEEYFWIPASNSNIKQKGGDQESQEGGDKEGAYQESQEGEDQEGGDEESQEGGDQESQEDGDEESQEGGDEESQEGGDEESQEGGDQDGQESGDQEGADQEGGEQRLNQLQNWELDMKSEEFEEK